MKRIITITASLAFSISLGGCTSPEMEARLQQEDIAWCQSMGATEQNGQLYQCVQNRQSQRVAASQAESARNLSMGAQLLGGRNVQEQLGGRGPVTTDCTNTINGMSCTTQ